MKRNALMFFALAVIAFTFASTFAVGPQQVTGLTAEDTTVVVRRMYEGQRPDMWGTDASPDGRYITQTNWGSGDLGVLDLLTGEHRRVTAKPNGWAEDSYSESAQFSPDGRVIAYVWYLNGDYEIRAIDIDGSNERIVLPGDPSVKDWPDLHDWSPNGTQLLVTRYMEGDADLLLVDVEDGTTQVLFDFPAGYGPGAAAFSPDGRYVGFDIHEPSTNAQPHTTNGDVYLIPSDGGQEARLLSGPANDCFLGFSPTGGDILFQSDRNLTTGVWRLPVRDGQAAGEPVLVKGDLWRIKRVGVSNGRLFYGVLTENPQLYTASMDIAHGRLTSTPAAVEGQPEGQVGGAAWSQDGLMLAYATGVSNRDAKPKLVIRSVDGEQAQERQSPFFRVRRMWWGPDRDRLIVYGRVGGDQDWQGLTQVDLSTDATSRYLNSEGVVRWAALTADRKTAYYAEWDGTPGSAGDRHFFKRHNLETGAIEHIARLDTLLTGLMIMRTTKLSPDEQSLAFQSGNRQTGEWTVGIISTVTGVARELARHPVQVDDPNDPDDVDVKCSMLTWSTDAQSIVYARAVTGQHDCTIYKVPVAGGEVEPIGRMPSHGGAAFSPDGSRVAFVQGRMRGELWMMDHIPWSSDR